MSESMQEISVALAKAQAAFKPINRDKTVTVRTKAGGTYSFSYAPLEAILRAVQPALSKEGLAVSQSIVSTEGGEYLETTLRHGSDALSNRVKILVVDPGPQAYGSALTYARRYGITLLLCVCADDDDDGNAAEGNSAMAVTHRDGEAAHGRATPADPRGEGYKDQDMKRAREYATRFRKAIEVGIDDRVLELHDELNADSDFYIAVSTLLSPTERTTIKDAIRRAKHDNGARQ